MKRLVVIIGRKRLTYTICVLAVCFLLMLILYQYIKTLNKRDHVFFSPEGKLIVVDPGHGGIDGGTTKDGILEKDINLDIAKKLKTYLEQKGNNVILTREKDVSLESMSEGGSSRHQRDLNARLNIINNSNADIFLSVHVNSMFSNPAADGSIVFYYDDYPENGNLAHFIQKELNNVTVDNGKRTVRDPQKGNYYILYYSKIPGVIIETAFISNTQERRLLTTEEFKDALAIKIAEGVERYFGDIKDIGLPVRSLK